MAKRGGDVVEKSLASSTGMDSGVKKMRSMDPATSFTCSNSEELDMNVLKFQNKMLTERLIVRQKLEADLKHRIEQSENKQTASEATVYVINRYWNQLNEDFRILLQRFDAEISDESENKMEEEATTSLLNSLSSWDSEEMSQQLQQRVDASTRAIMKVVQAFDRIVQRNSKVTAALSGEESLEEGVRAANIELTNENKNLHRLSTSLHEQVRTLTLQLSEAEDRVTLLEKENNALQDNCWDSEVKLNRLRHREEQLEKNIEKANERIMALETETTSCEGDSGNNTPSTSTAAAKKTASSKSLLSFGRSDSMTQSKLDELQKELEDQRELAADRLTELEELNSKHKDTLMEMERLKMQLQCLPSEVVTDTAEYKCLQSHFSVLYNETMQLKSQLEETRGQLQTSKNNHLRQIEHMEAEELSLQRRLRTEVIQLEDNLAQVRGELEMLLLENNQMKAEKEQREPINREMRNLITSLQNHNGQLKNEINRLKKKIKESQHEIAKLKHEKELILHGKAIPSASAPTPVSCQTSQQLETSNSSNSSSDEKPIKTEESSVDLEPGEIPSTVDTPLSTPLKKEPETPEVKPDFSSCHASALTMDEKNAKAFNELKAQLKELKGKHESLKSMYESSTRQIKDLKKQLASNSGKASGDVTPSSNNSIPPSTPSEGKANQLTSQKPVESDAATVQRLRDKIRGLEKMIQSQKQQQQQHEDALLSEMEVTGSAFENMQEQNLRLIQQLREKDDANFKLMSERIKSQQIQKLLKEEKESLTEQVIALNAQVEAQNQVVRKLEEKERLIQNNLSTIEKELAFKQQAMELHKRKAVEAAQSAADLKLHLDKYLSQLKEAQSTVAEKTSALQEQSYKTTRLQEDIMGFKRKYERAKKFELATTADEVLMEEIREYKSQLTCSACKTRKKDAVLTRCFHVFCYECLKTLYEGRERKCPKCNATFGAKDFHKLYLA